MRKAITLFCTVFILLSSGYTQSHRIGIYAHPQGNSIGKSKQNKLDPNTYAIETGKGFTFGGGVFYENCQLEAFSYLFGLGYTLLNNAFTSTHDTAVFSAERKLGFVTVSASGTYNFYATDNFKLGIQFGININYLISQKQDNVSIVSSVKKLHFMPSIGANCTYLFTENFGITAVPAVSLFMSSSLESTKYWGFGGEIRMFYGFGD